MKVSIEHVNLGIGKCGDKVDPLIATLTFNVGFS